MRVLPQDMQQQVFATKLRRYDGEEVCALLDVMRVGMGDLRVENAFLMESCTGPRAG